MQCRLLYVPFGNNVLCVFSYFCELIAKQRIESGFFLFQAEMKRKKEKKQSKKLKASKCRNLKDFMDSSNEDYCWVWFLSFWHVAYNLFLFLLYTKDGYMYKIRATHKYYCGTKYNRRGMRDFRSSPLLAPVGSGFLQYSRNNH